MSLPHLCFPDPALIRSRLILSALVMDTILGAGAAPAVAPHPDVNLVQPTAVAPVQLSVGKGASKSGVTVASNETLN